MANNIFSTPKTSHEYVIMGPHWSISTPDADWMAGYHFNEIPFFQIWGFPLCIYIILKPPPPPGVMGWWGCEVSCGGHHWLRGKTTTGSALDGAVFDQEEGRFWIYVQHLNLRAARKFTGTWSSYTHHAAVSSPNYLGTSQKRKSHDLTKKNLSILFFL